MNHYNICRNCAYTTSCVLTTEKSKVWSCSEYDEATPTTTNIENTTQPELEIAMV